MWPNHDLAAAYPIMVRIISDRQVPSSKTGCVLPCFADNPVREDLLVPVHIRLAEYGCLLVKVCCLGFDGWDDTEIGLGSVEFAKVASNQVGPNSG